MSPRLPWSRTTSNFSLRPLAPCSSFIMSLSGMGLTAGRARNMKLSAHIEHARHISPIRKCACIKLLRIFVGHVNDSLLLSEFSSLRAGGTLSNSLTQRYPVTHHLRSICCGRHRRLYTVHTYDQSMGLEESPTLFSLLAQLPLQQDD